MELRHQNTVISKGFVFRISTLKKHDRGIDTISLFILVLLASVVFNDMSLNTEGPPTGCLHSKKQLKTPAGDLPAEVNIVI